MGRAVELGQAVNFISQVIFRVPQKLNHQVRQQHIQMCCFALVIILCALTFFFSIISALYRKGFENTASCF